MLALAGAGTFRTLSLSSHATTNLDVIRAFLGARVSVEGSRDDITISIGVRPAPSASPPEDA